MMYTQYKPTEEHRKNISLAKTILFPEITKEILGNLYCRGKSIHKIARALNISEWKATRIIEKLELPIRKNYSYLSRYGQKYVYNKRALDILNPKAAWILGWLLSDGFAYKNSFGWRLAEKDREVLDSFVNFFEYDGVIYDYTSVIKNKKHRGYYLKITSTPIVEILKSYGIYGKKTLNEKFPNKILEANNEEITRQFIKGIFEGDGSVLYDLKYRSPCFQIVGTKELLRHIQDQLIKYLNLPLNKLTCNIKGKNHYALRYRGRYNAMVIFDWMYKNSEFHLLRKYNKYLVLKELLK